MVRKLVRKAVLVVAWGVLAPALAFTALMGFAHTRAGHPLLVRMMPLLKSAHVPGMSCPLGYDVAMTTAQKERARQAFAEGHRGTGVVAERRALGFTLDKTTSADVMAWAHEKHVTCIRPKTGYDLACSNVPALALPPVETLDALEEPAPSAPALSSLWMTFGEGDRLISLIATRKDPSATAITDTFSALTSELTKTSGAASAVTGEATPAYLSLGLLRQASAEYRFQNYYVMTRATNMGGSYFLSEEYRAL